MAANYNVHSDVLMYVFMLSIIRAPSLYTLLTVLLYLWMHIHPALLSLASCKNAVKTAFLCILF